MSFEIDPTTCRSFIDEDHRLCPRCSKERPCCEIEWVRCVSCQGDGWCYEEDWDGSEDSTPCDICNGEGGWWECAGHCDEHGKHKKAGAA